MQRFVFINFRAISKSATKKLLQTGQKTEYISMCSITEYKKSKKTKKKREYLRKFNQKSKFATARVKIFLVTRISRNKSIFLA